MASAPANTIPRVFLIWISLSVEIQLIEFRLRTGDAVQLRSTAIRLRRSRKYSLEPTSEGGVHESEVISSAFETIWNPCGEGCASRRLPSPSRVMSFWSAQTKVALGMLRFCQRTLP